MEASPPPAAAPILYGLNMNLDPLIYESPYNSNDLTSLVTSIPKLDLENEFVFLRPIKEEYLSQLENSPAIQLSIESYDRLQTTTALQRTDFRCVPFRVENIIIATSLGLWRTIMRSNEIIEALRSKFVGEINEKRRAKKNKLPIRLFFKFLNMLKIDVIVMTPDRESASVFFAKTSNRRVSNINTVEFLDLSLLNRTLLAFEFNPNENSWCPMQLPVMLRKRRVSITVPEISGDIKSISYSNLNRTRFDSTLPTDFAQSYNLDTMIFDRTVYNPQMVDNKIDEDKNEKNNKEKIIQTSPFSGMRYPNINQLDIQLIEVLRRGLHPFLYRNRLRFLISFPIALLGFIIGLALIIYVIINLETCCRDISTGECITNYNNESSDSSSCDFSFCNSFENPAIDFAQNTFLFGRSKSPGRFLIAAICCMFIASLATFGVNYFTTRSIARENSKPLFYIIIMIFHIIITAVSCGFSAYVLYVFSHKSNEIPCSSFRKDYSILCKNIQEKSGLRFKIEVQIRYSSNIELILSIILLLLSLVEFLTSLIPPMPGNEFIQNLPKARPETYVFYPSQYAPDGISNLEKELLRQRIARRLRLQLREQVNQHDIPLTRTATIGEMMLANREQSLNGGVLLNENNKNISRHWEIEEIRNPLHYMRENNNSMNTKQESGVRLQRELPPQVLVEVAEISSRIQSEKR